MYCLFLNRRRVAFTTRVYKPAHGDRPASTEDVTTQSYLITVVRRVAAEPGWRAQPGQRAINKTLPTMTRTESISRTHKPRITITRSAATAPRDRIASAHRNVSLWGHARNHSIMYVDLVELCWRAGARVCVARQAKVDAKSRFVCVGGDTARYFDSDCGHSHSQTMMCACMPEKNHDNHVCQLIVCV